MKLLEWRDLTLLFLLSWKIPELESVFKEALYEYNRHNWSYFAIFCEIFRTLNSENNVDLRKNIKGHEWVRLINFAGKFTAEESDNITNIIYYSDIVAEAAKDRVRILQQEIQQLEKNLDE